MLDSFFLVAAANKLLNEAASKHDLKEKVKERGWDHPEWNRELQEMIFDKYLWKVGACPEQEFLTTWELYQLAQNELNNQGYKWNPAWNRYTPKQGTYEYVRGTQIYNNLLNSEFHRYGEDLSLQDDIFVSSLIGTDDIFPKCLGRKEDGPTQYEEYLCCKTVYNSPNCNIVLFRDINYEGVTYNKYGEPFHWYDDLMPFTPSKVFIMYPSEKTYYEYEAKGIDLQKMQEKMRYTAYTTLDQRRQALNERNERIRNTRNH